MLLHLCLIDIIIHKCNSFLFCHLHVYAVNVIADIMILFSGGLLLFCATEKV